MSIIFSERQFSPPLTRDTLLAIVRQSADCFGLHRAHWSQSYLSLDGRLMVCQFDAPDTESLRTALRQSGSPEARLWPGTLHLGPTPGDANVLVERSFEQPVSLESVQALEDRGAWCLEAHGVTFMRTFFSCSRTRMLCLYRAPDAEAVRKAQLQAQMPVDRVWAFQPFGPQDLAE